MYRKVDQCWQLCQNLILADWNACLKIRNLECGFIPRWVKGTPKIGIQTLHDLLKNDLLLAMKQEDEENFRHIAEYISPVPTFWTDLDSEGYVAYSRGSLSGDIALIDLKNRQFLGEIQSRLSFDPIFIRDLQPLFYKNEVFILFDSGTPRQKEICAYSLIEKRIQWISSTPLPFIDIRSMHVINNHVVFHLKNRFAAISFENLKASATHSFLYTDVLDGILRVEKIYDKLLFLRKEPHQLATAQFLGIKEQTIKLTDCFIFNKFDLGYRQAYHAHSRHYVFFYPEAGNDYRLGSISSSGLISINDTTIKRLDRLIEVKDTVFLCSRNEKNNILIHTLDLREGQIVLRPLVIHGNLDLDHYLLQNAECFLDKLFLISYFDPKATHEISNPEYHLIVIDIPTLSVDTTHPLGSLIITQLSFISSALGKIHVMISQNDTHRILKVDYT